MPLKNLLNSKFGRLLVFDKDPSRGHQTYWMCRCDCGKTLSVRSGSLLTGNTKSCGCLKHDNRVLWGKSRATERKTHMSTWVSWMSMRQRCNCKKNIGFKRYGGRGITVCSEWNENFETFLSDMGTRPEGMFLDRIDNDKGYCKENCRWATPLQQSNNRCNTPYITVSGETKTISEWSRDPRCTVPRYTIYVRMKNGWSHSDAIFLPNQKKCQRSTLRMINGYNRETHRKCHQCGEIKTIDLFSPSTSRGRPARSSKCKPCAAVWQHEYRNRSHERQCNATN